MNSNSDQFTRESNTRVITYNQAILAVIIFKVSRILLLVFLLYVLASNFPPRLLEPAWILKIIYDLVNTAAIPLTSILLLYISHNIDPLNRFIEVFCKKCARLSFIASFCFVLLIALQISASMIIHTSQVALAKMQLDGAEKQLLEMRKSITDSNSKAELLARLRTFRGPYDPSLSGDFNQPLPAIRAQLLDSLDLGRTKILGHIRVPNSKDIWVLAQESVRVILLSIAFSAGFKALHGFKGNELDEVLDHYSHDEL